MQKIGKERIIQAIEAFQEGLELLKAGLNEAVVADRTEVVVDQMIKDDGAEAAPKTAKAEAAPKTKRGRKPKKEEKIEETAEDLNSLNGASEAADSIVDEIEDEAIEVVVSAEELRQQLVEYATKHSKDAAFKILGKYGASKVADLNEEQRIKVWNELQ